MSRAAILAFATLLLTTPDPADAYAWIRFLLPQAEVLHSSASSALRNGTIIDLASLQTILPDPGTKLPDSAVVARLVGRPFAVGAREDMIYCSLSQTYCGVLGNRLLITFDSLSVRGDTTMIGVTFITTWPRPSSSGTCSTPSVIILRKQGRVWELLESRRLRLC